MKYAKMLGLAAIAAMALTAFVGAGTASAKVCSGAGVGAACAAGHGNQYTGEVKASLTSGKTATLVSGFITVNCKKSVATGTITNSETGVGSITGLTFEECTSGLGACTAKSTGLPWAATATTGTAPNGTLTVKNVAGEFTCAGETCKYAAAEAKPTVTGGAPAEIVAKNVALVKQAGSGALCSANATWSGEYSVSTPASLYLT
jgi:hypothetical protein